MDKVRPIKEVDKVVEPMRVKEVVVMAPLAEVEGYDTVH